MERAIHTFKIRFLLGRIHRFLYSPPAACCSQQLIQQTHLQHLRNELEAWRNQCPSNHAQEALSLFTYSNWYELEYNYAILQLYRRKIIAENTEANEDAFLECLRAAEYICNSYRRQFLGKPAVPTWAALHELFLAGLTYLHCLWTSPMSREVHGQARANGVCSNCTIALVIMAERWQLVTPYREMFEALASKTIAMMGEKGQDSAAIPAISLESNDSNEEDWTHWVNDMVTSGVSEGVDELLNSLISDVSSHV